jgi:cytoskeletal protein CcmA (bactofilin family)
MARYKKTKAPRVVTVVGTGTTISGNMVFAGGLHVDGIITGDVHADGAESSALTLSESGTIEGEVRAPNIVINGTVIGDVYGTNRVELAPNAKVTGTVYYHLLEMAMGAEVNGRLVHSDEGEPRRLGYDGGNGVDTEENTQQEVKAENPPASGQQQRKQG